jgi:hypothetical protein
MTAIPNVTAEADAADIVCYGLVDCTTFIFLILSFVIGMGFGRFFIEQTPP